MMRHSQESVMTLDVYMSVPLQASLKVVSPAPDSQFAAGAAVPVEVSRGVCAPAHSLESRQHAPCVCTTCTSSLWSGSPCTQVALTGSLQRINIFLSAGPSFPGCKMAEIPVTAGQARYNYSLQLPAQATGTLFVYAKVRVRAMLAWAIMQGSMEQRCGASHAALGHVGMCRSHAVCGMRPCRHRQQAVFPWSPPWWQSRCPDQVSHAPRV